MTEARMHWLATEYLIHHLLADARLSRAQVDEWLIHFPGIVNNYVRFAQQVLAEERANKERK